MRSLLNIVFLISSIMSCIKIISTKSVASALIPFLMVVTIGLVLDLIEELKRYRNDLVTNSTETKIYCKKKFKTVKWSEVKVGNLIKVKKDEIIPADLFVICSSNKDGSFFLQTASLDGETNLKNREVLLDMQKIFSKKIKKGKNYYNKIFQNYDKNGKENFYIKVDHPNKEIYRIDGNVYYNNKIIPFDINNTAIRGALLKNTNFIYGIVIYTGKETKIMKNFIKSKSKFTYLDKLVDNIIFVILIIRIVYILLFMLIGIIYRYKYLPDYDKNKLGYEYLFYYRHYHGKNENNNAFENFKYFTAHFILSQTLLPTSVAVLLAITKVIQSIFIEFFGNSLREKPNQKLKCYSSELLGELGSIKYIFSDKTGTLTKNQTQFKACSIFTSLFDDSNEKSQSNSYSDKTRSGLPSSTSCFSFDFNFNNLLSRLKLKNMPLDVKNIENCPFGSQGEAMEEFILNMALNHGIVIDDLNLGKGNNDEIKYQGTNPDEITLVSAAKELGYVFLGKVRDIITIKRIIFSPNGKEEKKEIKKYKELLKIPFKSERQRSTIIVKDLKTNLIKLYIKGSDTKIFEKINKYSQESILEITREHIDNFARRGLRTLCYAFKNITPNEYNNWLNRYNKIKQLLSKEKDKLQNELIEEIENNCFLLGATALEDQMQDNVKKDIQEFIESGINFWMLTGDKMETAESIGYSIKLFDSDTEVYKIKGKEEDEIIKRMEEIKRKIKEAQTELSKMTIGEFGNKEKKMDFNTKFNLFKRRIKDNINVIYEDKNENEDSFPGDIMNNNNEIISDVRLKSQNRLIENGADTIVLSENKNIKRNESFNNMNLIINNFKNEELDKNSQKKESGNLSILKFMIDNQYFENSNLDLENMSIIKNKVEKPILAFSFNSDNDYEPNNIQQKENINNQKLGENILQKKMSRNTNYEDEITTVKYEYEKSQSKSQLHQIKKDQRLKTNLPIDKNDFLDYFDVCISKLREILYIQQKSFFLFKIPYLYGLINEEKDPLKEDIKKEDWKEKLNLKNYLMKTNIKYSLIIRGESIQHCISEKGSELFWFLIQHSRSIICCGCSPIQKSEIVRFVKRHTKETTLAIGDGENDVNMIKEANVGIGIFGKEGSQAAYNSDYAFSEFKYLKQFLFINGRFTLLRNTYFLNMFFFKNFLYTFQPIILNFYSLYSGGFFYDEFYDSMFNTFVSIFPLITFSIIDEDFNPDNANDLRKKISILLPEMYKQTRDSKPFNIIKYLAASFISLVLAIVISLIFYTSLEEMIKNINGDTSSQYELIFSTYLSILVIHFFMVYLDTSYYNYYVVIMFFIQIFLDIVFIVVMNKIPNDNKLSGITNELLSNIIFLQLIIVCSSICLPFYILRRMEYYFGINIANFIKNNNIKPILEGKYYKAKIAQMIRALSAVNKFKRINEELISDDKTKYDNLNDINMEKAVKHYNKSEHGRKKKKV